MRKDRFKSHRKILKVIMHNIHVKLICLFISFMIFLYVRYDREDTREYIADVSLRNTPKNLTISAGSVDKVSIIVKGFKDQLIGLPNTLNAYIDLDNATEGTNIYQIYTDNNSIPNNKLRIIVNPRIAKLVLEKAAYKTVEIKPDIMGVSRISEAIEDIKVNPSRTVIYGPKSIINKIDVVKTSGIDITDKINDYEIKSGLKLPPYIKTDLSSVDISIIFSKNIIKKEYHNLPVDITIPNSHFYVESKSPFMVETMIIEGSDYLINDLGKSSITLDLDLQDITNEGIYSNRVITIGMPSQIRLVSISPSSFDVTVKEKDKE